MELENLNIEEKETKVGSSSNLHKITPLSKYLAMALFIIMPFIGGWIGYNYAPEKVFEIEKVVVKEVEVSKKVIQNDVYKNPAYVTVLEGEDRGPYRSNNHLLGDSDIKTIYKYNANIGDYEVVVKNVRELKNFESLNLSHLHAVLLYGWSDDHRYIGFFASQYEGGVDERSVYYLDIENLDEGFVVVQDSFITQDEKMVSPDKGRILGINDVTAVIIPSDPSSKDHADMKGTPFLRQQF